MSIWMFLKTTGDLCLYFSVLAAFPGLFVHDFAFAWVVLLGGFGVMLSVALTLWCKGKWNLLGLVLCAAPLLLVTTVMEFLIVAPAVIYCAVVILQGQLSVEYAEYRVFFVRSMIAWAVFFLLISLLCWVEEVLMVQDATMDTQITIQYGLLYALAGVSLLRLLRMGTDNQERGRRINRTQTLLLFGGTGALLLGAVVAESYLQKLELDLGKRLLDGAAYLLAPFLWLFQQLLNALPEYDEGFETVMTQATGGDTGAAVSPAPSGGMTPQPSEVVENGFPWWLVILILLLMGIVLAIMLGLYTRRRVITASVDEIGQVAQSPKVRKERRSYRSRVRQQYREFLRFQRSRGVILKSDQTSQDILDHVSFDTNAEGAAQLRQVYLRARYDPNYEVTRQDAEKGRAALKKSQS